MKYLNEQESVSSAMCEERRCIEQAQAGSKEAFALLVLRYQSRVYASIVRRGLRESEAKELTQEVFLKAYLNLESFRFEASFLTWILRIGANHTTNYLTSSGYRCRKAEMEYQHSASYSASEEFDRDAVRHLKELVLRLPEQLQEVLILYAFEQRGYEEIAQVLDVPVGTVRSRLFRARAQIKQWYFNEDAPQREDAYA